MRNGSGKLKPVLSVLLILLPVAVGLVCLGIGRVSIPFRDVLRVLTGSAEVPALTGKIVLNLRLPRILLAILAGAGLSVAGCTFQSLFANPLATPDTLGVASGSCFGAVLGILLGFRIFGVQILSFAFGILAVALTWLCGSGRGRGLSSMVLSGIMIGSLFSALVSLVKYLADAESQLPAITYWLMGGLDRADARTLLAGAVPVILGIVVLFLLRWRLNLLPLSEDEITASGVNVKLLRGAAAVCATLITASCVSMCGQVGWVGLLIPHMCRMVLGSDHASLIPASAGTGAAFLVIVDTVARSVSASEIPISILTAVIGAPFFILLMRRNGRWEL